MGFNIVLFQGDSITDAGRERSPDAEVNLQLGQGYVKQIADKLKDGGSSYKVLNRGISGDTAKTLSARFKSDAIDLKPDYLSMLIGVNDVWHKYKNSKAIEINEYVRYLDKMLLDFRSALPSAKIFLFEPFVCESEELKDYFDDFSKTLKPYQKAVKAASEKYNTVFIPLQTLFNKAIKKTSAKALLPDGVHPSQEGHKLIAEAWLASFQKSQG